MRDKAVDKLPSFCGATAEAEALLAEVRAQVRDGGSFDARIEGVLGHLVPATWMHVDGWVERGGLYGAVCALAQRFSMSHRSERVDGTWTYHLELVAPTPMDQDLDPAWDRLRAHAAALDPAVYAAELGKASDAWDTAPSQVRAALAFVFADQAEWGDAVADDLSVATGPAVLLTVRDPARMAARLTEVSGPLPVFGRALAVAAAVLEVLDEGAAPFLVRLLDDVADDDDLATGVATALAQLPLPDVVTSLLERSHLPVVLEPLIGLVGAHPAMALRPCADATRVSDASAAIAGALLDRCLASSDAEVMAATSALRQAGHPALQPLAEVEVGVEPRWLATPPWLAPARPTRPELALASLVPAPRFDVAPGTLSGWRAAGDFPAPAWAGGSLSHLAAHHWRVSEAQVAAAVDGDPAARRALIERMPPDLCRLEVAVQLAPPVAWLITELGGSAVLPTDVLPTWLRFLVARDGADALPALAAVAATAADLAFPVLEGVDSVVLFPAAVKAWLGPHVEHREAASAWMRAHAETVALALLPVALGKPGAGRDRSERVLRWLVDVGELAAVHAAAACWSGDAVRAVDDLIACHPRFVLPSKLPKLPPWAEVETLPPLRLRAGGRVSSEGVQHLLTMFAMSPWPTPHPVLDDVLPALEPASCAAFGRALFGRWLLANRPKSAAWMLHQLAWTGDHETVRALASSLPLWSRHRGHAWAVAGVEVLAALGSDVALQQLFRVALRSPQKPLQKKAREAIDAVAEARGLDGDRLGDRLMHDLDLGPHCALVVEDGSDSFTLTLDERLTPLVVPANAKVSTKLPKPGPGADPDKVAALKARFKVLGREAAEAAAIHLPRLERAMCRERRWRAEDFVDLMCAPPLGRFLARRLVWASFDEDGQVAACFLVDGEGSTVLPDGQPYALPDGMLVGLPHPVHLDGRADAVAAGASLSALGLVAPFSQLDRGAFSFTSQEREQDTITRWEGQAVTKGRLLMLEARGWTQAPRDEHGWVRAMTWSPRRGVSVWLRVTPGMAPGDGPGTEQVIDGLVRTDGVVAEPVGPFSALGGVDGSEVLRDVAWMVGGT